MEAPKPNLDSAVQDPPPRQPAGPGIHLRKPRNNQEQRMVDKLLRALRNRDNALKQLAQLNRSVMRHHAALRDAGMLVGPAPSIGEAEDGEGVLPPPRT